MFFGVRKAEDGESVLKEKREAVRSGGSLTPVMLDISKDESVQAAYEQVRPLHTRILRRWKAQKKKKNETKER